jgi:hypothetical protein
VCLFLYLYRGRDLGRFSCQEIDNTRLTFQEQSSANAVLDLRGL